MRKIKWGVIACGGIADRRTLPGMMLASNCELVGVMDTNPELAEKVAQKYGAKFYLCTIMPTRITNEKGPEREVLRNQINEWIRTNDFIDGFVDFDRLTADKNNPSLLAQEYDSGDSLHPNLDGSAALCNAIPETYFL